MQWKGKNAVVAAVPYREWTWRITIFAMVLGLLTTVSSVYSGLKIANVISASAIAVILGMVFKQFQGTMMEVNIGQIVTSTIGSSAAGVIFTIPALYIMYNPNALAANPDWAIWKVLTVAIAGSVIGAAVIIPLRRQFIEVKALPFPGGSAMVPLVRLPGIPWRSIVTLFAAAIVAGLVIVSEHTMIGTGEATRPLLPEEWDIGALIGLPPYMGTALNLSMILFAVGMLAGRAGMGFLIGGIVAYWFLAPLVATQFLNPTALTDWMPTFDPKMGDYATTVSGILYKHAFRPFGIGMFIGSALIGAVLSLPVLGQIVAAMRKITESRTELSLKMIGFTVGVAAIPVLFVTAGSLPWWRVILVVAAGLVYMVVANMVVTECQARSAQQPVSGLSFVGAILTYFLSGGNVLVAIYLGCFVCSGITQGGDMMDDLFTSHRVGGRARVAQVSQLVVAWLGPSAAVVTVLLLAHAVGFGAESTACANKMPGCLPAPQATALAALMQSLSGSSTPWGIYGAGAFLGGIFTLLPVGGLGVLFGIAFYLPFSMTLVYGIGCLVRMGLNRIVTVTWIDHYIVPAAGGCLLGEGLAGTWYAFDAIRTIL